eukprot:g62.t1
MFEGRSKNEGASKVSVFRFEKNGAPPEDVAMAQNAMKRLKTLKFPHMLQLIDSAETEKEILLVTEPVQPLAVALAEQRDNDKDSEVQAAACFAWGTFSLCSALEFMHETCSPPLAHGALCLNALFATEAGDWRLGGFDFAADSSGSPGAIAQGAVSRADEVAGRRYRAPEGGDPSTAADVFALGAVLHDAGTVQKLKPGQSETGAQRSLAPPRAVEAARTAPKEFKRQLQQMLASEPGRRPQCSLLLKAPLMQHPFVQALQFLEQAAIQSAEERAAFYASLPSQMGTFPRRCRAHKILRCLTSVLEFDASQGQQQAVRVGSKVAGQDSAAHSSNALAMLPSVMELSSLLTPEQYKERMVPTISRLFAKNDRGLRVALLQSMHTFAHHLEEEVVNKSIFAHLAGGFTDQAPLLRELTVKAMLPLVPVLSAANLNERLMRHFSKVLKDPEAVVRTNTVICLGRIAQHLDEPTRKKMLASSFTAALRDGFPHARYAALAAISATAKEGMYDPNVVASQLLPASCCALLDPARIVRDQAAKTVDQLREPVLEAAKAMDAKDAEAEAKAKLEAEEKAKAEADEKAKVRADAVDTAATTSAHKLQSSSSNEADDGWGDGWGDDDDLDGLDGDVDKPTPKPKPEPKPKPISTSAPKKSLAQRREEAAARKAARQKEREEKKRRLEEEKKKVEDMREQAQIEQDDEDGWGDGWGDDDLDLGDDDGEKPEPKPEPKMESKPVLAPKKTLAQRREEAAARKAARLKEKEARKQAAASAPAPPTKPLVASPGGMKLSKKAPPTDTKESKVAKIKDMVEDSGWDDDW